MDHSAALGRLCRVCGRQMLTKAVKVKHLCSDFKEQFMEVFQIDIKSDSPNIHPQFFCHSCKIVLLQASSAVKQR